MNYFLSEQQKNELDAMSVLVTKFYNNSRGTRVSAKALLIGENICKLQSVKLLKSAIGNLYISVEFSSPPRSVYGYIHDIKFAPHIEIIFDYERMNELCVAFGHELKPKPEDMEFNAYVTHVARRIRTFVGQVVKIYVSYYKERRTDDFGSVETKKKLTGMDGMNHQYENEVIEDIRLKTMFCNINSKKDLDMWKIRCNFVS